MKIDLSKPMPICWHFGRTRFWGAIAPLRIEDHPLFVRARTLNEALEKRDLFKAIECVADLDLEGRMFTMFEAGLGWTPAHTTTANICAQLQAECKKPMPEPVSDAH